MEVVVSTEARFLQTPDGAVWTRTPYAHPWWTRYLDVFDGVRVLARVQSVTALSGEWQRVDGDRVTVLPVHAYVGPLEYVLRYRRVRRSIHQAVRAEDAVIMRVGSPIASLLAPALVRRGHPYALEVVGDPHDVFAPGVIRHPLRPLLRWWYRRSLERQCREAHAVAYVTARTLQRRYPAVHAVHAVSDVSIGPDDLVAVPRTITRRDSARLVFVGSLEQLYKGPEVLIDAVGQCHAAGLPVTATLVGEGRCRLALEDRARRARLDRAITFVGELPSGAAVRQALDAADVFVLPSRTEGLPRALIEAMARALPCLATPVGGIPELLAAEDLVPAGDAAALARMLIAVVRDPARMTAMSARNLATARQYHRDILFDRRRTFLRQVRASMEDAAPSASGRGRPTAAPPADWTAPVKDIARCM